MSMTDTHTTDRLTEDERALFERLADHYDDRPEGRIFELFLQPDEDSDSEADSKEDSNE